MPLNVLVSAYACGPNWGSEIGMGWNWVINLAQYCQLTVITEKGFKNDIETVLPNLNLKYQPKFHFIDIGEKARRRFWNQGDWRFYSDYRHWQWVAYQLAETLIKVEQFDLVHQLNMIGYREPGYLWKLPLPLIWGPIGGHAQMPWAFIPTLGWKDGLQHTLRNTLNAIQMRASVRVKKAIEKARVLIAATGEDQRAIKHVHQRDAILINETGTYPHEAQGTRVPWEKDRPLKLVWCGKLVARKMLPVGLQAIARVCHEMSIELHIVGSGNLEIQWKELAKRLKIEKYCHWYGHCPHDQALGIMQSSDAMLFTSVQEGTPHVILEALGFGLPIICHDTCGHGEVVNQNCGIKIPIVNPAYSIDAFAKALIEMGHTPAILDQLSQGAIRRAEELSWNNKAKIMHDLYQKMLA